MLDMRRSAADLGTQRHPVAAGDRLTGLRACYLAVSMIALLAGGAAHAQQAPVPVTVTAGDLGSALRQLGEQTGSNILFNPQLVSGLTTKGVQGTLSPLDAARALVAGTNLQLVEDNANTFRVVGPQTAPTASLPSRSTTSSQLEQVVVTAQKRTENVQKTPLAITAVTAASLIQRGVTNVQSLQQVVPGLQVQPEGNSTNFYIRGVGTDFTGESATLAIGYGIDGIFLGRSVNSSNLLFDVDRVEVLRGPQGSLNASNSSGGSIDIITKRPTNKYEGSLAVEVGNYGTLKTEGMLNLPLTDQLATRFSFGSAKHDGYTKDSPAADQNNQDDKAGRVRVLYKPVDTLSILAGASYYEGDGDAFQRPICSSDNGTITAGCPVGGYGYGGNGNARSYALDSSYVGANHHRNLQINVDAEWNLSFATLSYLAGYGQDTVDSTLPDLNLSSNGTAVTYLTTNDHTNDIQYSQEVRLANKLSWLEWTVGGYYEVEHSHINQGPDEAGPPGLYSLFIGPQDGSERAIFGQTTFSVTDKFRLIAGGRYNITGKTDRSVFGVGTLPVVTAYNGNSPPNQKFTTYRFGAEYDVAPQSLAYVTIADGYKPGGYNSPQVPEAMRYTKPEKLTDIEIGLKNRFFNNRLQINGDLFYYDYTNLQVSYSFSPGVGGAVNAAKASSKGVELSGNWLVTDADRVNVDLNYLDAKYDRFNVTYYTGTMASQADFTGAPLAHSPKWVFNFGYQHDFNLVNGATLTPRIDLHAESGQNMYFTGYPLTYQPAFNREDATLTYLAPSGRWQLQGYVRNLGDAVYLTAVSGIRQLTAVGVAEASFSDPRTYGLRVQAKF